MTRRGAAYLLIVMKCSDGDEIPNADGTERE
jgi:hypothetical protein